jgi:hypothetical protein
MITIRLLACAAAVFVVSISLSHAGPCSGEIDSVQSSVDAKLEANAAAGPAAKEGLRAGMSNQPTPRSIAAAEEKLGEISSRTVDAVRQGMARARAADAVGDKSACEKALAEVQRAISP